MRTFRQWFSRSTATLSLKLFIMYQVWPAVERSTSCHDSSHLLSWSSLRVAHYVSIVSSASQASPGQGSDSPSDIGRGFTFQLCSPPVCLSASVCLVLHQIICQWAKQLESQRWFTRRQHGSSFSPSHCFNWGRDLTKYLLLFLWIRPPRPDPVQITPRLRGAVWLVGWHCWHLWRAGGISVKT